MGSRGYSPGPRAQRGPVPRGALRFLDKLLKKYFKDKGKEKYTKIEDKRKKLRDKHKEERTDSYNKKKGVLLNHSF